jgi:uncharacterized protein (DUF433 family)
MTLPPQIPSLKARFTLDISGFDSSDGESQPPPQSTTPQTQVVLEEAGSFRIENSIIVEAIPTEIISVEHYRPRNFQVIQSLNFGLVPPTISFRPDYRALADKLCQQHPAISTDKRIFGGIPHIKNVRLSVGDVLAKLYVYGNIQKIVEIYSPHVSEEQVKDAIAYAQDFLETACDPDESSEAND